MITLQICPDNKFIEISKSFTKKSSANDIESIYVKIKI